MIVLCYPGMIENRLVQYKQEHERLTYGIITYDYETYYSDRVYYIPHFYGIDCIARVEKVNRGIECYCNNIIHLSNKTNAIILASAQKDVRECLFNNRLKYNHTKGIYCIFPSHNLKFNWLISMSHDYKSMLKFYTKNMNLCSSTILLPESLQYNLDYIERRLKTYRNIYYNYDANIDELIEECYPCSGYYRDAYCIDDMDYDIFEILRMFQREENEIKNKGEIYNV